MKEKDIYWQVVWCDLEDEKELVEALCWSEDEALKVKEELTKKRRYNDSFDYYRLDNHWVYEVRQATGAELEAERQHRIEKRMAVMQKSFWQYMDGEDFVEACRKSVAWVTEGYWNITDESIRRNAQNEECFYAPWCDVGDDFDIFAIKKYTSPHWLSVWALLRGSNDLQVAVHHFSSAAEYHQWASHEEDALADFMAKLREKRLSRDEICNLCETYHLNVCKHGGSCSSLQEGVMVNDNHS